MPGRAYFRASSTARRKNSRPMSIGSPPCQAIVTSGARCASMSCRMYRSSSSSLMRERAPGYSFSFSRKKQ